VRRKCLARKCNDERLSNVRHPVVLRLYIVPSLILELVVIAVVIVLFAVVVVLFVVIFASLVVSYGCDTVNPESRSCRLVIRKNSSHEACHCANRGVSRSTFHSVHRFRAKRTKRRCACGKNGKTAHRQGRALETTPGRDDKPCGCTRAAFQSAKRSAQRCLGHMA